MDQKKNRDLFPSQAYFVYKLNEYFKNFYHVLQNNRVESLRSILKECILIQHEINSKKGDPAKLTKSLHSQYKGLEFWVKTNPLAKHEAISDSVKVLADKIAKISADSIDTLTMHHHINSLYKRLRQINLVNLHIDIIQSQYLPFDSVDQLLDSIVSELIFEGCSLKHLEDWYSEHVFKSAHIKSLNNENILIILDTLKNIVPPPKDFFVIIYAWLPPEITRNIISKAATGYLEYEVVDCTKLGITDHLQTFGQPKQSFHTLFTTVKALDKYKAMEIASTSLENFLEAYRQFHNRVDTKTVSRHFCYISLDKEAWTKERFLTDDPLFLGKNDSREKEDIKQFFDLRNILNRQNTHASDISVLERVLFIVNKSNELSPENRLLNHWSSLEYILAFHHDGSIIKKAIDILPKVLCLYYVKDRMNTLWTRLVSLNRYSKNSPLKVELDDLFLKCKKDIDSEKYDKSKFAAYLADKDTRLFDLLSSNIVIQRNLAEVHTLLTDHNQLIKKLKFIDQLICHDLTRIYRIRNKIVHSGNQSEDNLEIVTGRLYRYLNSILGTLIYFISRSPDTTISEILCSILQTHEFYLSNVSSEKFPLEATVTPPYLFL